MPSDPRLRRAVGVGVVATAGSRVAGDGTVDWVLGPMEVDDLPEMLAIERASFSAPWSGALFLQELRVPFSRIVVARRPDGSILGYVCRWLVADEVHVLNVAVRPEERRRGIGVALVGEVLREAVKSAAAVVVLEVRRHNVAARALYAALGFEPVGQRRDYYGAGEDALIMQRTLTHG
jgi:[ribosomal protein S18]-alanine N-acetyltransferase